MRQALDSHLPMLFANDQAEIAKMRFLPNESKNNSDSIWKEL